MHASFGTAEEQVVFRPKLGWPNRILYKVIVDLNLAVEQVDAELVPLHDVAMQVP